MILKLRTVMEFETTWIHVKSTSVGFELFGAEVGELGLNYLELLRNNIWGKKGDSNMESQHTVLLFLFEQQRFLTWATYAHTPQGSDQLSLKKNSVHH